jgi:hypothetical protein
MMRMMQTCTVKTQVVLLMCRKVCQIPHTCTHGKTKSRFIVETRKHNCKTDTTIKSFEEKK